MEEGKRISLGEGHTPLVRSRHLGPAMGLEHLYFKLESINPSGSYKDRFAAALVSDLESRNIPFCVATSSGNTGAALAAYCAAAGISCFLAIVDGAPAGKLQQMQAYGAHTLMVRGFGKDRATTDAVISALHAFTADRAAQVAISAYCYSPLAMSGVETIAFELAEETLLHDGHVFVPAGGGGLTLAVINGFSRWKALHPSFHQPHIHCVQPEGNDTIAGPLRQGLMGAQKLAESKTVVSGLQVPSIMDGDQVIAGCRASGGTGFTVTDEAVFRCQYDLATQEGIYAEPAGAVALAGLRLAVQRREIDSRSPAICLVTGHGFKDPGAVEKMARISGGKYFESVGGFMNYLKEQLKK